MRKKIDPEVRARAVRLVQEHQGQYANVTAAVTAVANQLGVSRESVRRWLVQDEVDTGGRPGMTSEENADIKRLRAENKQLQVKVDILRAATVFFAGELDPRNR
jgi:transposase-like protein